MTASINKFEKIYDVIGVGIGPFNLGLAALLEDVSEIEALFFEKKLEFNWHLGMLIEGTTLQVPFFADLVSMADVTSKFSFLRYLQEHGRLYHFYFLEKFHISRKEYNDYCRWVSARLEDCRFGISVQSVIPGQTINGEHVFEVKVRDEDNHTESSFWARHLVTGIGSVPSVPEQLQEVLGESVFHSSEYLFKKEQITKADSVAVIGSGQSSAEVFLDLAKVQENHHFSLNWYTRSQGFFPMEYSKLGLEYFSPDYTEFFYQLPQHKKDSLMKDQDLLYKGISAETIAAIYDHLYERSIGNVKPNVQLQAMSEIVNIEKQMNSWRLHGDHLISEEQFELEADVVILGTGYRPATPEFLFPVYDFIEWDEEGRFKVKQDYRLETNLGPSNEIFVQNGEVHTHGVGAPDLGLGAHRNAVIINSIAGKEVYPVHSSNVFQTFGTAKSSAPRNTL